MVCGREAQFLSLYVRMTQWDQNFLGGQHHSFIIMIIIISSTEGFDCLPISLPRVISSTQKKLHENWDITGPCLEKGLVLGFSFYLRFNLILLFCMLFKLGL